MKVKVLKEVLIGKLNRKVGEIIEIEEEEARLLISVQVVEAAPAEREVSPELAPKKNLRGVIETAAVEQTGKTKPKAQG